MENETHIKIILRYERYTGNGITPSIPTIVLPYDPIAVVDIRYTDGE